MLIIQKYDEGASPAYKHNNKKKKHHRHPRLSMGVYTFTLWQCSEQRGDKPVLNLSAKINVHAGEILA